MKKKIAIVVFFCVALLVGCGGSDASKTDIKEPELKGRTLPEKYEARAPDSLVVVQNVDGHPNPVVLCYKGVAWMTISTSHSGLASPAIQRVAEYDETCPKGN